MGKVPGSSSCIPTHRLHVAVSYILNGFPYNYTLGPKYIPYSYMEPFRKQHHAALHAQYQVVVVNHPDDDATSISCGCTDISPT